MQARLAEKKDVSAMAALALAERYRFGQFPPLIAAELPLMEHLLARHLADGHGVWVCYGDGGKLLAYWGVKSRDYDSAYFGFSIYGLEPFVFVQSASPEQWLPEKVDQTVMPYLRGTHGVMLARIPASASVLLAAVQRQLGWVVADTRATLLRSAAIPFSGALSRRFTVLQQCGAGDGFLVDPIARAAFASYPVHWRALPGEDGLKAAGYYASWVQRAARGQDGQRCLVAHAQEGIKGFISWRYPCELWRGCNVLLGGGALSAVASGQSGVYPVLLGGACAQVAQEGGDYCELDTHVTNLSVMRAGQALGVSAGKS